MLWDGCALRAHGKPGSREAVRDCGREGLIGTEAAGTLENPGDQKAPARTGTSGGSLRSKKQLLDEHQYCGDDPQKVEDAAEHGQLLLFLLEVNSGIAVL